MKNRNFKTSMQTGQNLEILKFCLFINCLFSELEWAKLTVEDATPVSNPSYHAPENLIDDILDRVSLRKPCYVSKPTPVDEYVYVNFTMDPTQVDRVELLTLNDTVPNANGWPEYRGSYILPNRADLI